MPKPKWILCPVLTCAGAAVLAFAGVRPPAAAAEDGGPGGPPPERVAERLAAAVEPPALAGLAREVLAADPEIAAAESRARAAAQRVPQAASLPDPTAMATAFLASPETRVGPQRLTVAVSQALPWLSKLGLREQMAVWDAAALAAEAEAVRVAKLTEARRLYFEIAFSDELAAIQGRKHEHLLQHEEAARARYATGVGESQGVVKLQAEITRTEAELLTIDTRRRALAAALEALRGRPQDGEPLPPLPLPSLAELPELPEALAVPGALLPLAKARRPEITAAAARRQRAGLAEELAHKERRPDFTVGLTYTVVDPREDGAGRLNPPVGNGNDVLGIQGGVRIPLWRERLAAAVEEAAALKSVAAEEERRALVDVGRRIDELTANLPLHRRRAELFEDVLILQADQALASAEAGYIAGRFSALDLLDAEHVLFDAYAAAARARADVAVALAQLEGAVGAPLAEILGFEPEDRASGENPPPAPPLSKGESPLPPQQQERWQKLESSFPPLEKGGSRGDSHRPPPADHERSEP